MAKENVTRKLAAILYADVVGYSRLTGEDEEGTHRTVAEYLDCIAGMVSSHDGRVVHYAGDAVLADFPSVVAAVKCAVDVQKDLATRNSDISDDCKVQFRIGVNLGDVIVDRDDIYGNGVNVAARLESLADPGGICISDKVLEEIQGKVDLGFEDMGPQAVKNIARPVQSYRVVFEKPLTKLPTSRVSDKPSIAVLPFNNLSGDPEQEYFADGMAEDITTDLSKISSLFVVARNSSFVYKSKAVDIREVSRALGVKYVLEGSVRKGGNKIRINAQLIDAESSGHLWAERYDGDMDDIFGLQDNITSQIVSALELNLTSADRERIEHKPTHNVEAYDLYLRGRSELFRYAPDGGAAAARYFEKAIEKDPKFAEAYGFLAYCRFRAWVNGWPGSDDTLERAKDLAQKAVELDDRSSVSHTRLAWILAFMRRFDEALPLFEKALDLDPNDPEAYAAYGLVLVFWGDAKRGLRINEKAFEIDRVAPPNWYHHRGLAHFEMRQYDNALLNLVTATERAPYFIPARLILACLYSEIERQKEAEDEVAIVLQQNPKYTVEIAKRYLCYRHEENLERVFMGLRKAGLPE